MQLKDYQTKTLDALSVFLERARAQIQDDMDYVEFQRSKGKEVKAPDSLATVWGEAMAAGELPEGVPEWRSLKDGTGASIPHLCLKLPTGGGKTFIASHAVERIQSEFFDRRTGLVLWVVPSQAIYEQTKAQLWDRGSPLRQVLERASAGRVKLLEKLDGLTLADTEDKLCVLLLMLQSTGRESKESLKVFRDSGNYRSFFPEEDDYPANAALKERVPNLDLADWTEGEAPSGHAVIKQSMGNMLRIVRPLIVLDEGHKSYSEIARSTLAGLNPSFVLELSATPNPAHSNVLVNVPGTALKDEEMIKLPLELARVENTSWQGILERAWEHLEGLRDEAETFRTQSGRYIRPIMLVRVDRTGKDQREPGIVHAEDVFEHLTQKMGVNPDDVRRQTATQKELKGEDLLSEYSSVRVVITKDALREGWDCPFAYSLVVLSPTTAPTALTQMVGRILRQPHAKLTGVENLDKCYVWFTGTDMHDALKRIQKGLSDEGMGDLAAYIRAMGGDVPGAPVQRRSARRAAFKGLKLLVPRVLKREGKGYREIDYERDVLAKVNWESLSYSRAGTVELDASNKARIATGTVDLETGNDLALKGVPEVKALTDDAPVKIERPALIRLLMTVIPNPWQGARILDEALAGLGDRFDLSTIHDSRFLLVDDMREDLARQVDELAESAFRDQVASGDIVFKLVGPPLQDLNWDVPQFVLATVAPEDDLPLFRASGTQVEKSLFEPILKAHLNGFERDVALYLDEVDAVHWWHRIAARSEWGLQGWRKNKVYPDFLIWADEDKGQSRLIALETKGRHLEGADDTEAKRKLFELLEAAYSQGHEAGEVELFADKAEAMRFTMLMQPKAGETAWKSELAKAFDR